MLAQYEPHIQSCRDRTAVCPFRKVYSMDFMDGLVYLENLVEVSFFTNTSAIDFAKSLGGVVKEIGGKQSAGNYKLANQLRLP